MAGNDLEFSTAVIYRTYDDYANDAERYFLEYFMRDAYEYYGYDFKYYDSEPVDEVRLEKLVGQFTTMDHYIRDSWYRSLQADLEIVTDGDAPPPSSGSMSFRLFWINTTTKYMKIASKLPNSCCTLLILSTRTASPCT